MFQQCDISIFGYISKLNQNKFVFPFGFDSLWLFLQIKMNFKQNKTQAN